MIMVFFLTHWPYLKNNIFKRCINRQACRTLVKRVWGEKDAPELTIGGATICTLGAEYSTGFNCMKCVTHLSTFINSQAEPFGQII